MPLADYGYYSPTNVELLATLPGAQGTASTYIVVESDFHGFHGTMKIGPARRRRVCLDNLYA